MRTAEINRKTAETDIRLTLNLDGRGTSAVDTGIGFLDHMLTLFARHGRFDLTVTCVGDIHVDGHHTAEDVGLCLGSAFLSALGELKGLVRYGDITLPMDEALVLCAADISGRSHLTYDVALPAGRLGTMDTELLEEFWQAFVRRAGLTLHLHQLAGSNTHHIAEACFKATARALRQAVAIEDAYRDEIPSTKGVL